MALLHHLYLILLALIFTTRRAAARVRRATRRRLFTIRVRARHRARMLHLALTLPAVAGGAPDGEGDDAAAADDGGKPAPSDDAGEEDDSADDTDDDEDAAAGKDKAGGAADTDWKRMARKHEREAKKARREREDLEKRLKAREDMDKSEQEKAIEQAEQRARQDLESKFETERRSDRLEVATTKLAAKGVKLGSGDKQKTVRFADPDDAMLHIQRDINNGDLDPEDIFDENGKVKTAALTDALTDLLDRKPHLAADSKPARKVDGDADGGRGGPANTDVNAATELEKIRRHGSGSERSREGARYRKAA